MDLAPAVLTDAIRKVHDFLTVGAPAPLQEGVAAALDGLDRSFYDGLATSYRRSATCCTALSDAGFRCLPPEGAYYILADFATSRRPSGGARARRHWFQHMALPGGRCDAGAGVQLLP